MDDASCGRCEGSARAWHPDQRLVGSNDVQCVETVEHEKNEVHTGAPLVRAPKRARYSRGPSPSRRANARRRLSGVPKPDASATASTDRSLVSSKRRAVSTRTRSTYAAGGRPTSARKIRPKFR